jgi:hypothetical protein
MKKKLSQLPPLTGLDGTEILYAVRDGVAYQVLLEDLAQAIKTAETIVPANLPYRGARVIRTTDSTGITFPVIVAWNEADFDTDNFFNPLDPTKLVIPAGVSKVRLVASIATPPLSVAGSVIIGIRKNQTGTDTPTSVYTARQSARSGTTGFNDNIAMAVTGVIDVVEGDYFDVRLNVNMTGNNGVVAGVSTFFEIEVVEVTGV